jgi:membrane protease YdiL (CAAX protease family)
MKTATGLALVAVGAILAFAVTGHPGWLNVQAAGWVLILVGLAGMFVPRRGYGWLKRRVVRRPATARTVVASNGSTLPAATALPAATTLPAGTVLPPGTVVLTPEQAAEVQAGALVPDAADPEVFPGRQLSKAEVEEQVTTTTPSATTPATTTSETIEEYLEE